MCIQDWVNIAAIVASPIIAIWVGQVVKNYKNKRNDQMYIFKTLMMDRGLSWNLDSVKCLNVIDIVFEDKESVIKQWRKYHDKIQCENPTNTEIEKMNHEKEMLLLEMAKSLGYKKVTLDVIQKPYTPNWIIENMIKQKENNDNMYELLSTFAGRAHKEGSD